MNSLLRVASFSGLLLIGGACSSNSGTTRPPGAGGGDQTGAGGAAGSTGGGSGTGGASGQGGTSNGGAAGGGAGNSAGGSGGAGAPDGSGAGAPGDASADRGETGAAPVTAVLSDDFEALPAGPLVSNSKWTVDLLSGSGIITIDDTIGHNNSAKSLHVNANNAFHTMVMAKGAPLFPAPGNKFFGRVYLRLGAAMPTGHITWIEAGSVMNDVMETRIGGNIGALDINRWPGDTEQRAPPSHLTALTWQCLELMFDGGGNEARVWLDSTELTALHVTDWVAPVQANGNNSTPIANWAPSYDAVRLGWELGTGEIWFDDVAFAYQRIGCL